MDKPRIRKVLSELENLLERTEAVLANEQERDLEAGSDSDSETEFSNEDAESNGPLYEDIRYHLKYLIELAPTIEQNLAYARKTRIEASNPPVVPFHLSDPAKVYVALVQERYKNAHSSLVDRLGEANWQRHKDVRERMEKMQGRPDGEITISTAKSVDYHDSAFSPAATFHASAIGTSVPATTEYAQSYASSLSSNTEGRQWSVRVPPAPEEVGTGNPFQCPICSRTLVNVRNRIEWKSVIKYGIYSTIG